MQLLLVWLIFTVPACIILSKKHRGAGEGAEKVPVGIRL